MKLTSIKHKLNGKVRKKLNDRLSRRVNWQTVSGVQWKLAYWRFGEQMYSLRDRLRGIAKAETKPSR